MINTILLSNYKHFFSLELNNLKRINILSGKNNTGKTSILEALFMLYDRGTPDFTLRQFAWRGVSAIELSASSLWQPIFNNFDLSKKISIEVHDSGHKNKAIYSHIKDFNSIVTSPQKNTDQGKIFTSGQSFTESLKTEYITDNVNVGITNLFINAGNISMKNDALQQTEKRAVFIHSSAKGNTAEDAERLGKIEIETGLDEIINYLKIIEPRLTDLSIIPHGQQTVIYGDIGLSKKIPISYMGEGITKLLSILATIVTTPKGVICIDEIENGIHYSLFSKIWRIIETLAIKYQCQLFITTHSYDALLGVSECYKDSNEDAVTFIRLDMVNNKISPKIYSSSTLIAALENKWEVR